MTRCDRYHYAAKATPEDALPRRKSASHLDTPRRAPYNRIIPSHD